MKNIDDARKLSCEVRQHIRNRAIELHKKGFYPDQIAESQGVSIRQVYRWIALYVEKGFDGLKINPRSGPGSSFTELEMQRLAQILIDHTPRQYQFEFSLWTLNRVRAVIKSEFCLDFSFQWVSVLLKRMGFSPQRPKIRATQRDEVWVARWLAHDLPSLKARALTEGASIWYGDESAVRSQEASPRTWSPVGKTPVIEKTAKRFSVNLISAICGNGELEFMATSETINGEVFCLFLERLIHGRDSKIILVLDNSSIHSCKVVREFVALNEKKLELVYLPPYYPDGNPDELVWAKLKKNVRSVAYRSKEHFQKFIYQTMTGMQQQKEQIRNFVRHCGC